MGILWAVLVQIRKRHLGRQLRDPKWTGLAGLWPGWARGVWGATMAGVPQREEGQEGRRGCVGWVWVKEGKWETERGPGKSFIFVPR
jgi:hypothetical protein